jgi:hypothetical protein
MAEEKKQAMWVLTGIAVAILGVAILVGVFLRTV